jgi:GntR family transcriptional regulator, transcriptional repressor for pyruvate dehydrogenase complex
MVNASAQWGDRLRPVVGEQPDDRLDVPPAYAVVVEHLRRAIMLGTYAPGDKLPPEREHAERLGVSRVTLREAVRVLEGEGLVEVRRGSMGGTTVRGGHAATADVRRHLRGRLDTILATQEFRLAIEPLAAARAAERRTKAALKELQRTIAAFEQADRIGPFRRADSIFHLTLARNAACPPLARAVEDARIAMFELVDAFDFTIVVASSLRAHTAILECVERRDPEGARAAMHAHIEETTREIHEVF